MNTGMAHTSVGGLCRCAGSRRRAGELATHPTPPAMPAAYAPNVAAPRCIAADAQPASSLMSHRRRRCGAHYRTRCAAPAPCRRTAGTQLYTRPAGQPPPPAPGCALLAYAPRRLERLCAEAGCCRSEHCSPNEACATTTPPHQQHSPRPATRLPSSSPHPYLVQSP